MRVKTYRERAQALMERIDSRLGICRFDWDGTAILFRPRTRRDRELSDVYFNLVELMAPDACPDHPAGCNSQIHYWLAEAL